MVSRPHWKGYVRLSLVSCAVRLYRATSSRERLATTPSIVRPTDPIPGSASGASTASI